MLSPASINKALAPCTGNKNISTTCNARSKRAPHTKYSVGGVVQVTLSEQELERGECASP